MTSKLTKMHSLLALASICVITSPMFALEMTPFQMREDYGTEPLSDCILQYYYCIPCPTYSWFWASISWDPREIIGQFFTVGDVSMGGFDQCDVYNCMSLEQIRVLDFAGYGTAYPGLFTIEFDVYCSNEYGCPVGSSLWNSGPWELEFGWNYVPVDPAIEICNCAVLANPVAYPRILVTATMTGSIGSYPAWGFDNISTPILTGCEMHDNGCLTAFYPRPYNSHYITIHSGTYGVDFEYCPSLWFLDGRDTTPDATQYGAIELAWRIYLSCTGPTGTEASTWGSIKAMFR